MNKVEMWFANLIVDDMKCFVFQRRWLSLVTGKIIGIICVTVYKEVELLMIRCRPFSDTRMYGWAAGLWIGLYVLCKCGLVDYFARKRESFDKRVISTWKSSWYDASSNDGKTDSVSLLWNILIVLEMWDTCVYLYMYLFIQCNSLLYWQMHLSNKTVVYNILYWSGASLNRLELE